LGRATRRSKGSRGAILRFAILKLVIKVPDDMRFCCPNCAREEEVLVDRNPRCRYCQVKMIPASAYSELWMSPYIAIRRMATISETYGIERARADGRFKKEREAWTTAVFALALSKLNGEQWWIEVETVDNTPDTRLRQLDQSSGNNVIQTRSIEVVDWEENVDDIMQVIGNKCRRAYPRHYLLLVNARNSGKMLDLDRVIEEMKKIRLAFLEVWVIAFIGPGDIKVARVAPSPFPIDLNIRIELEKARQQVPFIRRGTRGRGTEVRDLRPAYLPIPRGD